MPKNAPRSTISHLHKVEIMLETAQGLKITEKTLGILTVYNYSLDNFHFFCAATVPWCSRSFKATNLARENYVDAQYIGYLQIFISVLKSLESRQFIVCKVCVKGGCSNGNQMRLDEAEGRTLRTVFVTFWARFPQPAAGPDLHRLRD